MSEDVVYILRNAGYGGVERKDAVLDKIEEIWWKEVKASFTERRRPLGATEKLTGEFK